jgi:hypothetical protein
MFLLKKKKEKEKKSDTCSEKAIIYLDSAQDKVPIKHDQ